MFGSTVSIEEHDDGRRRLVEFEVAETLDSVTGAEGLWSVQHQNVRNLYLCDDGNWEFGSLSWTGSSSDVAPGEAANGTSKGRRHEQQQEDWRRCVSGVGKARTCVRLAYPGVQRMLARAC